MDGTSTLLSSNSNCWRYNLINNNIDGCDYVPAHNQHVKIHMMSGKSYSCVNMYTWWGTLLIIVNLKTNNKPKGDNTYG